MFMESFKSVIGGNNSLGSTLRQINGRLEQQSVAVGLRAAQNEFKCDTPVGSKVVPALAVSASTRSAPPLA